MKQIADNLENVAFSNIHWEDFCDTVARLGKSTSYFEPKVLADIYQKPYVGNSFFDLTKPAPLFNELTLANEFIERLWSELAARLKNLQLIAKDSTNTSSPPSHDSIAAKAARNANSQHKPSGKKQGAQLGYKANWRKLRPIEEVDEVIACYAPDCCTSCENPLSQGEVFARKQVSYFEDKRHILREFQRYQTHCEDCDKVFKGKLPKGTPRGALGACVHGLIGTLDARYRLSKHNIKEGLEDFWGICVSIGTISNTEHTVSKALAIPADEVHEALKIAPVTNNDETSHYCKHKLSWLWVMGNDKLAYFAIQDKRDTQAAKYMLGNEVTQVRITDRYGAYNFIPKKYRQHCWSHLKRDIKAVSDDVDTQQAALGDRLEVARKGIFRQVRAYKKADEAALPTHKNNILQYMKDFRQILRDGCKIEKRHTAGFCRNLIRDWQCLWHFLRRDDVEPTNNHGERLLRHGVIWRKISHGTQSERGNRYVERSSTVNMTCRLQKKHLPTFIQDAVKAYWEGGGMPSLVI